MNNNFKGINPLQLDIPNQIEFNRRKNVEQDEQIETINSTLSSLVTQSPAGFLPRVYYGLTSGIQTYRFTSGATFTITVTGTIGTAFELYSQNETDNAYIPAILVKDTDTTLKVLIQGDYTNDSTDFIAVNMVTGASTIIELDNSPLTQQDASSLANYPAADNQNKEITVIHNLENNSDNVVFASIDINSDGIYNWIEIANFVDGTDGKSIYTVNSTNYSTISSVTKPGDTWLAGATFTVGSINFVRGTLYNVDTISPLAVTPLGDLTGPQGVQGNPGQNGQDGSDGYTPYIQDGYWYINGSNTGVKALGTDGSNGTDGQSFQMQSGLYSTPDNWGETGNVDADGNPLLQLPTLPQSSISGKGYVVYDPLTTPLSPYYDLYYANNGDNDWTIIHPFSGIAGQDGTDGYTPYIQNGYWYINGTNTGVPATGPQGATGATGATFTFFPTTGILEIVTP